MPGRHDARVDLTGHTAVNAADGSSYDLGRLEGVHILVLMRHRH
jgi:hypothetical protein